MKIKADKCRRCASTTVWVCLVECLFVACFKVVIGLTSGSKAMLGSALYSLTDLTSAFLLIVSLKVSKRPPDSGHPYGHGKIEHLVSLFISLIVLVGTVALLLISLFSLYHVDLRPLHWIGVWASLACLCLNHIVYRLVVCAGRESNSPAMLAHAKHVRLDSISNIAVIVAIVCAEAGLQQVDPVIAILEAAHVLVESSKMIYKTINQLMDASVEQKHLQAVRSILLENPDVKAVRDIKGLHAGRGISLDIEVLLDGHRKIGECNATVRTLNELIRNQVPGVDNVRIHFHPYPVDERVSSSAC